MRDNNISIKVKIWFTLISIFVVPRFTKGNSSECNTPRKITGILDGVGGDGDDRRLHQQHNTNNNKSLLYDDQQRTNNASISRDLFSRENKQRESGTNYQETNSFLLSNSLCSSNNDDNHHHTINNSSRSMRTSTTMMTMPGSAATTATETTTSHGNNSIFKADKLQTSRNFEFNDSPFQRSTPNNHHYHHHYNNNNNTTTTINNSSLDLRCSTPLRSFDDSRGFPGLNTSTPLSAGSNCGVGYNRQNNSRSNASIHSDASDNSRRSNKGTSSFCLGDFMTTSNSTSNNSRSKRRSRPHSQQNTTPDDRKKSSNQDNTNTNVGKPKRRVVPTAVAPSSGGVVGVSRSSPNPAFKNQPNEFTTSSFKTDNNLLGVMSEECELDATSSMLKEREILLNEKNEIKKDFFDQTTVATAQNNHYQTMRNLHKILEKKILSPAKKVTTAGSGFVVQQQIDLTKIKNKHLLDIFINIHSIIIELNLAINILTELSYLLNLVNIDVGVNESRPIVNEPEVNDYSRLLKNVNNCIYYSFGVLDSQKQILALLDTTTMRVLIENERIASLDNNLWQFLKQVHSHKLTADKKILNNNQSCSSNNVFYQEENDTRYNYPSDKEFRSFRAQRDMFYNLLRNWEFQYLNRKTDFNLKLDRKVYDIITTFEHPINMSHLAKLFVAQLIVSCNYNDTIPELQSELPNIDPDKLSKLQQRLVAPSNFSTEYMFPGVQAFYRDFIMAAQFSINFLEHLKIVLIAELITMNGELYGEENFENTLRPDSIATMRVLAKFIGFIVAIPYKYDNCSNIGVDEKQIQLRNTCLPAFDIRLILINSLKNQQIVITIPWIVQYLTMLDHVTLQLNYYKELLNILYEIYISLETLLPNYRPTSKFIVRTCLGWLFDHPTIPEEFYVYRQNREATETNLENGGKDWKILQVIVPSSFETMVSQKSLPLEITKFEVKNSQIMCTIQRRTSDHPQNAQQKLTDLMKFDGKSQTFNPNLERLLNSACPFLADFRVSIMPTTISKSVSRTGKYRHITTKLAETNIPRTGHDTAADAQKKLLDEFLQSQSQSVRKIIDFVIDRVTSAVIKDYQMEYLLAVKDEVAIKINEIEEVEFASVKLKMQQVYQQGLENLARKWDAFVPGAIETRVTSAYDALLPKETLTALKSIYIKYTIQQCSIKTFEWKNGHCSNMELFTQNLKADAQKLYRNIQQKTTSTVTITDVPFKLDIRKSIPSKQFIEFHCLLHKASMQANELNPEEVIRIISGVSQCLEDQDLKVWSNKLFGFMVLQLVILLICNRPEVLIDSLYEEFIRFFKAEKMKPFVILPPTNDDEPNSDTLQNTSFGVDDDQRQLPSSTQQQQKQDDDGNSVQSTERSTRFENSTYIFDEFINRRLVEMFRHGNMTQSWEHLAKFLIHLIANKLFSVSILNVQYLALLKYDLDMNTAQRLSKLLATVSREFSTPPSVADVHEHLFAEMLSELTKDICIQDFN